MVTPSTAKRIRQVDLLRAIRMSEPVSCPQLAEMLNKTRQAIHLRLKLLEKRGMIERAFTSPDAPVIPVYYRCSQRLKDAERRLSGQEED
jgi:DNA-binding MarR family transcriptional regulator